MSQFPLQTLLELAQQKMDEAGRRLAALLASEQQGEEKLQLLKNYRDEYHARFVEAGKRGMGPQEWRNFQDFLGRLDEAIAQQQQIVDQARQMAERGQQAWLSERTRAKAFDILSQRHETRQQQVEAKRQQKEADEFSTKKFLAGKEP